MEAQRKPEERQPYEHLLDPCPYCHSETFILIKRSRIGTVIGAVFCRTGFDQDPEDRTHCPKIADIPQRLLVPFPPSFAKASEGRPSGAPSEGRPSDKSEDDHGTK